MEAKLLLTQLLGIESKVVKGDANQNNVNYQQEKMGAGAVSLRELFEKKPSLSTRRTEVKP